MRRYVVGGKARLTLVVTDEGRQPADPASLSVTILRPDGVVLSRTMGDMERMGVGLYVLRELVTQVGVHRVSGLAIGSGLHRAFTGAYEGI